MTVRIQEIEERLDELDELILNILRDMFSNKDTTSLQQLLIDARSQRVDIANELSTVRSVSRMHTLDTSPTPPVIHASVFVSDASTVPPPSAELQVLSNLQKCRDKMQESIDAYKPALASHPSAKNSHPKDELIALNSILLSYLHQYNAPFEYILSKKLISSLRSDREDLEYPIARNEMKCRLDRITQEFTRHGIAPLINY